MNDPHRHCRAACTKPLIRLARAIWARLHPRHEHDWKPVHTVASGCTLHRCTTCRAEEIG